MHPQHTPSTTRRRVLRLVDAGTVLLRLLAVPVALLGLLVTPVTQLLVVPGAALLMWVLLAYGGWQLTQQWPPRAVLTTAATAVGAAVPFVHGTDLLGPPGTAVAVAVLVLCTTSTLGWIDRVTSSPAPAAQPDGSWQELVHVLPLGMLLAEWRSLELRLQEDAGAPADLWRVRTLLLEELLRRDPAAVARWWDAEPGRRVGEAPGDDGLGV